MTIPLSKTFASGFGHEPGPRRLWRCGRTCRRHDGAGGLNWLSAVSLEARGDENALGFSVGFDPGLLTFLGAKRSSAGTNISATLNVNSNQVAGAAGFPPLPWALVWSGPLHPPRRGALPTAAGESTVATPLWVPADAPFFPRSWIRRSTKLRKLRRRRR